MKTPTIPRKIMSCAFVLASRCQKLLQCVARRSHPTTSTDRVTPQQASRGAMLVESDIKKGVRGILP